MISYALLFNPQKEKLTKMDVFEWQTPGPFGFKIFIIAKVFGLKRNGKIVLERIKQIIKENTSYQQKDNALEYALAKVNRFTQRLYQKKNIQIDAFVLAIDYNLNLKFSFLGKDFKFLILRQKDILEFDPSKMDIPETDEFSNIIEGELQEQDKLIILSKDLFPSLWQEKFFLSLQIASAKKQLKQIIKQRKSFFKKLQGLMFICLIKKEKRRVFPSLFLMQQRVKEFRNKISKLSRHIFPDNQPIQHTFADVVISLLVLGLLLLIGYLAFH